MGEIAEMMLTGIMCAMDGVSLECDFCNDMGIPMYCSDECAKDQGLSKSDRKVRVCDKKYGEYHGEVKEN